MDVPTLRKTFSLLLTPLERRILVLACSLLSLSSLLGLIVPKLAGAFLDDVVGESNSNESLIALIGCVSGQQIASGVALVLLQTVGEAMALRLRCDTFAAVMRKPQAYFDGVPRQKMLQSTLADVDAVRQLIVGELGNLVERALTVVGGIAAVFVVSTKLAMWTMVLAPVIAISLGVIGEKLVYPLEQVARNQIALVSESADEAFTNVQIVKSFGMEKLVAKRFEQPALARYYADRKSALGLSLFKGTILYVAGMVLLFACWYGRYMVREEKSLQPGDLIAFLVYAVQIALSIANSTRGFAVISVGTSCAKHTFALLEDNEEQDDLLFSTPKRLFMDRQCNEIRFENVFFSYPMSQSSRGDAPVLNDVSFSLLRGKSTALVGPSGAGKSSVLGLLEKFYQPTRGAIYINDTNLNDLKTSSWRDRIGLVTQDACLFAGTIAENIAAGSSSPDDEGALESKPVRARIERAAAMARVDEFSNDLPLKLDTSISYRGLDLSSGQRQRIALARAFYRNPQVLLLDEHTSQLDATNERLVQEALDLVSKDCIVLLVAHRLQTARRCDKICVMVQGRIVESGTHDKLMVDINGAYHQLWVSQSKFGGSL